MSGARAIVAPPPVPLRDYQLAWLADHAKRKCLVKARRIGGTFVVGMDVASEAIGLRWNADGTFEYNPRNGVDQFIVGPAKRQSKVMIKECAKHIDALCYVLGIDLLSKAGVEKITLRNGRVIEALPANPDTVRGHSGSVTFEECQSIPNGKEMWTAAKAVADPNNARPEGFTFRANGTALNDDNLLYWIARTDFGENFSQHQVDIHKAIKAGFPANIPMLMADAGDPEIFAQEYECQFMAGSSRYFSASLYDNCLYDYEAGELPKNPLRTTFSGMDVGRKSDGDPSVICDVQLHDDDLLWQAECESRRGMAWTEQESWVASVLSYSSALAVDATGIGDQFAERLGEQHGASRIKPVVFGLESKQRLITGLKLAMSSKRLHLRDDDVDLRRDVLSVRREFKQSGRVTYEAERTKKGHADRAWALALAVDIANDGVGNVEGMDLLDTRPSGREMDRFF